MKKLCAAFTAALFTATAVSAMGGQDAPSSGKTYKIGIAKIVQHQALDDIERGIMDVINESGIKANYDLQNANGDVNTAAQIASLIPVTLRSPCAVVDTSPAPTGSVIVPNTTGTSLIVLASATATGVAIPTATSTRSSR